jgi:hypothetical protein
MTFKLISDLISSIINTVQETAITQTRVLRNTVFKSEVSNFPKVQVVKGKVEVDQSGVVKAVGGVEGWLKKVDNAVRTIKPTKAVSVTNFPKFPKYPEFPKELGVTVKNPVGEVSVSNQPKKELNSITTAVKALGKEFSKIEFKPEIKVEPTPVMVTQEKVTFPEIKFPEIKIPEPVSAKEMADEMFHKNPKEYIPVRLSDGKEFYEALASAGGSGGTTSFVRSDGTPTRALVNDDGTLVITGGGGEEQDSFKMVDLRQDGLTTYLCYEDKTGLWYIKKLVEDGEDMDFRYAAIGNNPSVEDYTTAFASRETLTYGNPSDAQI